MISEFEIKLWHKESDSSKAHAVQLGRGTSRRAGVVSRNAEIKEPIIKGCPHSFRFGRLLSSSENGRQSLFGRVPQDSVGSIECKNQAGFCCSVLRGLLPDGWLNVL